MLLVLGNVAHSKRAKNMKVILSESRRSRPTAELNSCKNKNYVNFMLNEGTAVVK